MLLVAVAVECPALRPRDGGNIDLYNSVQALAHLYEQFSVFELELFARLVVFQLGFLIHPHSKLRHLVQVCFVR